MAKQYGPEGIILDIKLPGVDGWGVMERLRAEPETAAIPVHVVSANEAAGERGMAMGAVGYLTKPASPRDIVRVIDSLVRRPGDELPRVLVVEDDVDTAESVVAKLTAERLEVRRVNNAGQAVEALRRDPFACMILDLSLPDMDGLELLQSLPQRAGPDVPAVIVYTGRALSKEETRRIEAYAEAVVLKEGHSAERLMEEIRLFVRRLKEGLPLRREVGRVPAQPGFSFKGRKMLVVDDDMRTVYALSALLRAKGAEVFVADTGRAALDALAEHPEVELVLMDMMMPEMDGYEALRHVRRDVRFRELPVIALTAMAMKGDREKCLAAGASDYLAKPIDPDRLMPILLAHVSKSPSDGAQRGS